MYCTNLLSLLKDLYLPTSHPSLYYSLASKRVSVLQRKMQPEQQYTKHVVVKWIIRGNARTNRIPAAPRLAGSPLPGLALFLLRFGHVVGTWQNTRTACGQTG
jgi:hypothetical protein